MISTSYIVYFLEPKLSYLLVVTSGVNLPAGLIFLTYFRRDSVEWAGRASIWLKVLMIPALATLLVLGL